MAGVALTFGLKQPPAQPTLPHRPLPLMKTNWIPISLLALAALTMNTPAPLAADGPPVSEAAREQYLRDFKRIGLNTTPGDARTLRILVQSTGARRGVEVGSATGYGALQMGVAFERNGGQLITVDIDPDMVRATRDHLRKTGLEKTVTVIEGDALKVLPGLEGEFDFVFIDAVKSDYLKYLKALEPKLKPGALVVADNVIRSAGQMRDYLEYVQDDSRYETVILRASDEKGDGMAVSYKRR